MSLEADRSEILGDSVPSSSNVLDFSNKLDLNKLLGSGGSHPIVLRVLEQNSRSQPVCAMCCLSKWYSVPTLTSALCLYPLAMKDIIMRRRGVL